MFAVTLDRTEICGKIFPQMFITNLCKILICMCAFNSNDVLFNSQSKCYLECNVDIPPFCLLQHMICYDGVFKGSGYRRG